MAQSPMYAAMVNSPGTELAADINATDTEITVLDASKLPAAPNLVTVGGDETAETIMYTGKTGNTLTGCTRGFEGTAKGWAAGSPAARNHTAYDYDAGRANIADLDDRVSNIVIPDGTTTQKGIVQLSNATESVSETEATTPKAVNDARVAAITAAATDATTKANAAQTAAQTALNNHANTIAASSEAHGMRVRSGKLEYYDGSNWLASSSGLDLTTTFITYYVNATTGNDSNDGLTTSTAFKTINKALSLIPPIFNNPYTIHIAAGTYVEDINISHKQGNGYIDIIGPTSGSPAILSGRVTLVRVSLAVLYIRYLTINQPSNATAVEVTYVKLLRLSNCVMTASSSLYGVNVGFSTVYLSANTISNKQQIAIFASSISFVFSENNSGNGNAVGLGSYIGSTIVKYNTQPSGTTAELVTQGGLIRS